MEEKTVTVGTKKTCCQDEVNLRVIESKPTITVRRCQVCGCRHFEATAEAGTLYAQPR